MKQKEPPQAERESESSKSQYSRSHRSIIRKNPIRMVESASSREKKQGTPKMSGMSLPEVVRVLLKDDTVLRWDSDEFLYEVINGPKFESRYKCLSL